MLEEGKTIKVRGSKVVGKIKEQREERNGEPRKPLRSFVQVTPPKNNPRKFVQVVECANPQSWVEEKPDAMEQMRKELAALEERNLRTLVQACWRQPNHSMLDQIAGCPLSQPPTNTQFLDMLASYLRKSA